MFLHSNILNYAISMHLKVILKCHLYYISLIFFLNLSLIAYHCILLVLLYICSVLSALADICEAL